MVENAFVTDQCTKFIFALFLCRVYLIRTQAFSVFSEASLCCASTPRRDRTIHTRQSQKQQLYEQKRRPVDDLVFIPCNVLFWRLLSQLPSAFKTGRVRLFYLIAIGSFTRSDAVNRLSSSHTGRILDLKGCVEVCSSAVESTVTAVHCSSLVSTQSKVSS